MLFKPIAKFPLEPVLFFFLMESMEHSNLCGFINVLLFLAFKQKFLKIIEQSLCAGTRVRYPYPSLKHICITLDHGCPWTECAFVMK